MSARPHSLVFTLEYRVTQSCHVLQSGNKASDLPWVEVEGKIYRVLSRFPETSRCQPLGWAFLQVTWCPMWLALLSFPLSLDEGTEAQNGSATCLRPPSCSVQDLRFAPSASD